MELLYKLKEDVIADVERKKNGEPATAWRKQEIAREEDINFAGKVDLIGVIIPEGVKHIPDKAFEGCYTLTRVDLPNTLESIGNESFKFCNNLWNFTFPKSVRKIGDGAFWGSFINYGCAFTFTLPIPGNIDFVIPDNITEVGENAFLSCTNFKSVKLSKNIKHIPIGLFNACRGIESFIVPEGVESIAEDAFFHCICLKDVTLPNSLKVIDKNVFNKCHRLTIHCPSKWKDYCEENGLKYEIID